MKYKVGDKVRVRKDLKKGTYYYMSDKTIANDATQSMIDLAGKTVTIYGTHLNQYRIKECSFEWTDDMFEGLATETTTTEIKLEGNMKFEIKSSKIVNNKGTQVMFVEFADGDIQKAVCLPGDTFDEERGLEICVLKHVLGGSNYYNKIIKTANKQMKDILDKEQKAKEEADRIAKKKAKNEASKARRAARRAEAERVEKETQRAEHVADMTKAFSAALKENNVNIAVDNVSESTLEKIFNIFKK